MSAAKEPNLILLPGLDGTGILFRPLLAVLPEDIRSRVISYPSGQSLSLAEHARLVAGQLPDKKVVLLAESFSGLVALRLISDYAPRLNGVLFVGGFAQPPRRLLLRLAALVPWTGSAMRSAPSFLLRQFCLGTKADSRQLALLRQALAEVSSSVLADRLGLVAARQSFGKKQFAIPCHYLQASQDRLVPPAAARWFQDHFQSCEVECIEGPHFMLQAHPQPCAEWVTRKVKLLAVI